MIELNPVSSQIIQPDKIPLLILAGPTAVGKTSLSIRLAQALHGSVVSADSMQVYRGMDIGTAKITEEEKQGIPHYLIDVLDPSEEFNVVLFQKMAKDAIRRIRASGRLPILTGGTGFYIQALLYDIDFTSQEEDRGFREAMEQKARDEGPHALHEMLRQVDPVSAEKIHANNIKRTIRALEFYRSTGRPISEHNAEERQKESPYDYCYFVLTDDREKLYQRIEDRIDQMMEKGLLREVETLMKQGVPRTSTAMQGLGYKELYACLAGECSLEEAVRLLKRDTRHFAKRQLTWFRREKQVIWINRQNYQEDEDRILQTIKTRWENRSE
ncbi:MAG TPA: tRNA (adenosine(37)-N6)-dimethylallyltransferase MiaA [Lachnospiraceae bacterium]|nr:tRNA (adenosine(37)-N6)-dimethylallyltransferase MiaA [Lachnospiraceae bacterium]